MTKRELLKKMGELPESITTTANIIVNFIPLFHHPIASHSTRHHVDPLPLPHFHPSLLQILHPEAAGCQPGAVCLRPEPDFRPSHGRCLHAKQAPCEHWYVQSSSIVPEGFCLTYFRYHWPRRSRQGNALRLPPLRPNGQLTDPSQKRPP